MSADALARLLDAPVCSGRAGEFVVMGVYRRQTSRIGETRGSAFGAGRHVKIMSCGGGHDYQRSPTNRGDVLRPKGFAGLFSAAPPVALATLTR